MIEAVETRHGTIFIPDSDSGQYWWLKMIGDSPECEYMDMVCALLDERPRGAAIDAGANFGCWTVRLADHADRVVAIEPQRAVAKMLRQTVAANRLANVRVEWAATGARDGTTTIPDVDPDLTTNFGGISVGVPHPEHPDAPMANVPVRAIDWLGIEGRVTFIKADVEGSEAATLRGARRTIARWRPILFVEVDHPLSDGAELAWLIEQMGYSIEQHGNNVLGMPL